ncbi:MAG: hypothetical protein JWO83_4861 [Caulobacteraceae bacterium]|jgi:hypothetical protein|nr:hypothetical protein [Caulobacteraceae bacterium]
MKIYNGRPIAGFALLALLVGGCSTVMEATRPAGTNINKYVMGEKRIDVVADLGAPLGNIKDGENSCDVYKFHTKGTNGYGKTGIIFTEAAADFFTLGLAEVVLTPAEAASNAHAHSVMFCYDDQNKLITLKDAGKEINLTK